MNKKPGNITPDTRARIHEDYATIQTAQTSVELYTINKLEAAIKSAGGDYSVLDASGKKSSETMEDEFRQVVQQAYLRWARMHYQRLRSTDTAVFRENEAMKTCLTLANQGLAALDPTGKKSYAEAQYEYEHELKEAYIREGRSLFRVLKGKNPTTAEDAGETLKDLISNGNLKAADLDPRGQRSDADMLGAINYALQIAETRREGNSNWMLPR